jgi:hypothetical protein
MLRRLIVAAGLTAVVGAACTSSGSPTPARSSGSQPSSPVAQVAGDYRPAIDPANFSTSIDNSYYPLVPGTTYVYEGVRDHVSQRDVVTVTSKTKVIAGVTCVVVTDVADHNGTLLEKTEDWFAQDKEGNVWYFGEATAEYKNGKVSTTEGSWQTGKDGAEPGIIMPAHPEITDAFRQEYLKGQAEDQAWIIDTTQSIKVPDGTFTNVIRTLEWSRLEPDVIDGKWYAPGIGIIKEVAQAGGQEVASLVSVTKG